MLIRFSILLAMISNTLTETGASVTVKEMFLNCSNDHRFKNGNVVKTKMVHSQIACAALCIGYNGCEGIEFQQSKQKNQIDCTLIDNKAELEDKVSTTVCQAYPPSDAENVADYNDSGTTEDSGDSGNAEDSGESENPEDSGDDKEKDKKDKDKEKSNYGQDKEKSKKEKE